MNPRLCGGCGEALPDNAARQKRFCGDACRMRFNRYGHFTQTSQTLSDQIRSTSDVTSDTVLSEREVLERLYQLHLPKALAGDKASATLVLRFQNQLRKLGKDEAKPEPVKLTPHDEIHLKRLRRGCEASEWDIRQLIERGLLSADDVVWLPVENKLRGKMGKLKNPIGSDLS